MRPFVVALLAATASAAAVVEETHRRSLERQVGNRHLLGNIRPHHKSTVGAGTTFGSPIDREWDDSEFEDIDI